ncbi:hypothetical protein PSEUDO8Z_10523 [Pseudomonas sp. 8Z]|nr:hypothetical protein PSEUDO8Z_10523 [Pseudomonas sp. 8Z]
MLLAATLSSWPVSQADPGVLPGATLSSWPVSQADPDRGVARGNTQQLVGAAG